MRLEENVHPLDLQAPLCQAQGMGAAAVGPVEHLFTWPEPKHLDDHLHHVVVALALSLIHI